MGADVKGPALSEGSSFVMRALLSPYKPPFLLAPTLLFTFSCSGTILEASGMRLILATHMCEFPGLPYQSATKWGLETIPSPTVLEGGRPNPGVGGVGSLCREGAAGLFPAGWCSSAWSFIVPGLCLPLHVASSLMSSKDMSHCV